MARLHPREGGSAYCDIYTGGAAEAHFCASTIGWGGLLQEGHPLKLVGLLLGHGWSLVRTASLMTVEYIVAVVDCARGVSAGNNLWKELLMVPARVTIGVLLRELSSIGPLEEKGQA